MPLNSATQPDALATEGRRRLAGAFFIDIVRLRPDPNQPRKRFDDQSQQDLVASIRQLGILQPIAVRYLDRENIYQIISGERRFQAAQTAGLAEVPCWVQTPQDREILLRQIAENWQRSELHPYDLADALVQLRDSLGLNQKQLADLTGKPESEVSRFLSLLKLNPMVQRQAREDRSGVFSRRHLIAVAQLKPEDQQEVMVEVVEKKLTAIDTEKLVVERKAKHGKGNRRGAPAGAKFRFITSLGTVGIAFRRAKPTTEDLLAVLEEVQTQVVAAKGNAEVLRASASGK